MRSGGTPLRYNENNNSDYNSKRTYKGGVKVNSESGASTDHIYKVASKGSSRVDQSKSMEHSVAVPTNNGMVQNGHSGVNIELERL
jgi:hypothetical protein